MNNAQPVIWQSDVVGFFEPEGADMFDLYGAWAACVGSKTTEFLDRLRRGEQLWVAVGSGRAVDCTVEEEPVRQINLKIRLTPEHRV